MRGGESELCCYYGGGGGGGGGGWHFTLRDNRNNDHPHNTTLDQTPHWKWKYSTYINDIPMKKAGQVD